MSRRARERQEASDAKHYPGGGIYMLFAEDGELLYVGQSLNVYYRETAEQISARL